MSEYYCYLISSEKNPRSTYIGITNNLNNRLKKHNGILKGGAKATRKHKDWYFVKVIKLESKSDALKLEWYWKHYKNGKGNWVHTKPGIDNKLKRLEEILDDYVHTIEI